VNKAELIEALTGRLGDRKSATAALDAVLSEIQNAVSKGDKVSITGFGVFEKRIRAARTARNPRTGAAVRVARTSVPAFRPGTGFREQVAGGRVIRAAKSTAAAKKTVSKAVKKTATKKATPARPATARKTATTTRTTTARKAPARKAPASKATARKSVTRTTARKAPARAATGTRGSSSTTSRSRTR
jgi:DNA-binding protein HU-beta